VTDNPVQEKDYSVLPKQQAFKVHAPDAPTLVEGVGTDLQTVHSVMLTNDMHVTWTTGEPGDSFPLHSHMPEMYQILTTIKGECIWYYKDNDDEEQSIKAGPGDVVYLPGGAENRVEVVGDEEHIHIGSYPRVRVPRVEQLTGIVPSQLEDPKDFAVGVDFDNVRDEYHERDESCFEEG
jgi:quercetin dioxygenase-like cupin family protein